MNEVRKFESEGCGQCARVGVGGFGCEFERARVRAGASERGCGSEIVVQKSAVRSWYALGPFLRRYPWLLSESRKCMKLPTSRRRSVNTLRSAATVNRELYLQMASEWMKRVEKGNKSVSEHSK